MLKINWLTGNWLTG